MRTLTARRLSVLLVTSALAVSVSACGSSSGGGTATGSDSSAAIPTDTAVSSEPPAAAETTAAEGSTGALSEADLGTLICDTIREVQAGAQPGWGEADFMAGFVGPLSSAMMNPDNGKLYREKGDQLAAEQCPAEYTKFLEQAKVSSITLI